MPKLFLEEALPSPLPVDDTAQRTRVDAIPDDFAAALLVEDDGTTALITAGELKKLMRGQAIVPYAQADGKERELSGRTALRREKRDGIDQAVYDITTKDAR